MKRFIKTLLSILFIFVFCYCSYNIIVYLINENKSKKTISNLQNMAIVDLPKSTENIIEVDKNTKDAQPKIEINFEKLTNVNKDIKAWLYLENSIINYPVVKGGDNSYYLTHSADKKYNLAGSIFIDYRNNENFKDLVTYIYGHHMKNNTMFGNLEEYKNQEYYTSHKDMYLFAKEEKYKMEIFASMVVKDGDEIYNFTNAKSNEKLVEIAKEKSNIKSDIEISKDDKIVVLSTCSYEFKNARYVVIGVLRKI